MKKAGIIIAALAVVLLVCVVVSQVIARTKTTEPTFDRTEKKTTVQDVLNADEFKDLQKIADKAKVTLQEIPEDKNRVFAEGYKIASVPLEMTISKNDNGEISSYEGYGSLFNEGEKVTGVQYKEKIMPVIQEFAARFNISADQYEIFEISGNEGISLDISQDSSYQSIVDKKAQLTFYVKDSNGDVWLLRSQYDKVYDTMGVELRRIIDPSLTKDLYCKIDLSQTKTEG